MGFGTQSYVKIWTYVGSGGEESYVIAKTDNITVVRGENGFDGGVSDYDGGAGDNSAAIEH